MRDVAVKRGLAASRGRTTWIAHLFTAMQSSITPISTRYNSKTYHGKRRRVQLEYSAGPDRHAEPSDARARPKFFAP